MRNAYRIFAGKPKGKRATGKIRCRWKDKFEMVWK
jgi:hypothetical protein